MKSILNRVHMKMKIKRLKNIKQLVMCQKYFCPCEKKKRPVHIEKDPDQCRFSKIPVYQMPKFSEQHFFSVNEELDSYHYNCKIKTKNLSWIRSTKLPPNLMASISRKCLKLNTFFNFIYISLSVSVAQILLVIPKPSPFLSLSLFPTKYSQPTKILRKTH